MWKTKNGFRATYGNLLELFVDAGHTPCAEVLCELLTKKSEFRIRLYNVIVNNMEFHTDPVNNDQSNHELPFL